jgi:hypothetical protein
MERMSEDAHPGKFGSIARSVNIHIDKLGRDAKSAKKDLDQLLGPAPEGSLGTIDLLATALPSVRPGGPGPAAPPPPSEFRFNDGGSGSGPMPARATAVPPPAPSSFSRPGTPPPMPSRATPPPPGFGGAPAGGYGTPGFGGAPAPSYGGTPAFGAPSSSGSVPISASSSGSVPISTQLSSANLPAAPPSLGPSFGGPQSTSASAPPLTLDDDILGGSAAAPMPLPPSMPGDGPRVDPYFKQVFDQFIALKRSCNEQTSGLTYEKFTEKLIKNRDDLISKTGCRDVRFTVYVKDGKAALKATPVKDE